MRAHRIEGKEMEGEEVSTISGERSRRKVKTCMASKWCEKKYQLNMP